MPTDVKSFDKADDVKELNRTRLEIVHVGAVTFTRITLQPDWRWENDVQPTAGTRTCMAPHSQTILSGHLHITMDDGTEFTLGPGDVARIEPGHLAYVIGQEPVVAIEVEDYVAKNW